MGEVALIVAWRKDHHESEETVLVVCGARTQVSRGLTNALCCPAVKGTDTIINAMGKQQIEQLVSNDLENNAKSSSIFHG